MSITSPTSTTSTDSSGYQLSSLTGSSTLQVTGLSSGLNTDQIVEELMAAKSQPLYALEDQQGQLTARNTALQTIQSQLQTVQNDAQALLDPSLYDSSQTVSSSDSTSVGAAATNSSGEGAVEGGYEVAVTQLAQSAQRTFTYSSPSSADTITIDGQAMTISAGESTSSFVSAVNNSSLDVYATETSSGAVVLSDRATGDTGSGYIQVADSGGALTEVTADAKEGQNAEYTVDGVSGTSASNTVTDAIAGVTLTLSGLTGSTPVTVDVNAPAVNSSGIETALNQFITDYNTAITNIQTQLSTTPTSTSSTSSEVDDTFTGTLYNDQDLQNLLGEMRSAMITTVSGLSGSMNNMLDVGVSTGATTGTGSLSTSAIDGDLTLDTSTLSSAIASDPNGVQSMLAGWASSFSSLVGVDADTGGTMSQRISDNQNEVTQLGQQISTMQDSLSDQQTQLVNQFAAMESALSTNQSESSWLTQQIASLS